MTNILIWLMQIFTLVYDVKQIHSRIWPILSKPCPQLENSADMLYSKNVHKFIRRHNIIIIILISGIYTIHENESHDM